jgi:nucleoid DNA-binding protein
MKEKILLTIILLLFAVSVTGLEHSEEVLDHRMDAKAISGVDTGEEAARCSLRFDGGTNPSQAGNVQTSLSCPDGGVEHSDDWIGARLVDGSDSRAPEEVAVVSDPVRCPDGVCYRMSSGSIEVNVVNDPPSNRGNSVGNPAFEQNDLGGEMPDTEMNSAAVIGFGSFSISKRSARTGRNPQTGKAIQGSGDESDRALANRMLSSIKASDCPEDGRERCVVEAVKNSEVYSDLSSEGEIEILMTLTADPLVAPRSDGGDFNDSDTDLGPGELCENICHFIVPDFDGDGYPDLAVERSGNIFNWTVDGETVAETKVNKETAADTQVIFMQVETDTEATSRAELIDAIASTSGLSKADSKKALEGFINTTNNVASEPECCFDYNSDIEDTPASSGGIDKATPKLYERLEQKDKRIAELEDRIRELESGREVNSSVQESPENGDDQVVRKKPGRASPDTDSDGDGLEDATEEESLEPVRRPGFVDRMLSSIFGR